ncbi:MAG: hypothetical protein LBU37_15435 [Tannerellaceae bacterium]|jgi:hypothetical protein|nr:hypothetical protein [Tannerellaceae bacterium]
MKKIIFIFALVATALVAPAQETVETVVELTNGSIIRGKLTDMGDGQRSYIKTTDGSIIYFTRGAVKEIDDQKVALTVKNFRNPKTVYFYDGSIVKGKLSISTSGERMKVETSNGSVIYFTKLLAKEIIEDDETFPATNSISTGNWNNSDPSFSQFKDYLEDRFFQLENYLDDRLLRLENYSNNTMSLSSSGNNRIRTGNNRTTSKTQSNSHYNNVGYRGFVDLGIFTGISNFEFGGFAYEITTSHGYQFNPYIFLGGGLGLQSYKKDLLKSRQKKDTFTMTTLPIFADFRANVTERGPVIPFAGLKIGSTTGFTKIKKEVPGEENESESESETKDLGAYIVPSVGVNVMLTPSFALNFGLEYTFQLLTDELYDDYYYYYYDRVPNTLKWLTIKAGIAF